MTALAKRPLESLFGNNDDTGDVDDHYGRAGITAPSSKRQRCESPAVTVGIVAGDLWDDMECDQEDVDACESIVGAVLDDDDFSIEGLAARLATATTYQVELAMVQLFGRDLALGRLCDAIVGPSPSVHTVSVDALLYRAARDHCPTAVATLVARLAEEDDVAKALTTATEEDDIDAAKVIVKAYESDANTPAGSCRRVACAALSDAAEFGKTDAVDYFAGLCDGETIEEMLVQCAADSDDPTAAVFAALWRHADLCAHAYAKSLLPCPALDYLREFVESGEPCADGCMSNVSDDDDSDDSGDDDGDHVSDSDDDGDDNGEGEVDRPDRPMPL
ncbi:hypothetical protein psal_cds_1175 [Pandoravirus salinus]|uniref:Uncharacterized protein n=1 Tax=Pandoravirus salinus TaxID=1349410 RepID=S4W427_9VIRU|nr:hypothetical protein psal_cds_1175 [Pandoravirus salinus]AGO85452.1 hypothetical protein psal_cds_1175 [Pandoravirus salinus]